jgi:hypothetical protein
MGRNTPLSKSPPSSAAMDGARSGGAILLKIFYISLWDIFVNTNFYQTHTEPSPAGVEDAISQAD